MSYYQYIIHVCIYIYISVIHIHIYIYIYPLYIYMIVICCDSFALWSDRDNRFIAAWWGGDYSEDYIITASGQPKIGRSHIFSSKVMHIAYQLYLLVRYLRMFNGINGRFPPPPEKQRFFTIQGGKGW